MELNFDIEKDYLGGDILYYVKDMKPDNKICLICHFKNATYDKLKLCDYENINVILCAERYRDEITIELLLHNKNINIINI